MQGEEATFLSWRQNPNASEAICVDVQNFLQERNGRFNETKLIQQLVQEQCFLESEEEIVFLECYPWEKPNAHLTEALKLLLFHGKEVRADLLSRCAEAMEINEKIAS